MKEGDLVRRTGRIIEVPVGESLVGRGGGARAARDFVTFPELDRHRQKMEAAYRIRGTRAGFLVFVRRQGHHVHLDAPEHLAEEVAAFAASLAP